MKYEYNSNLDFENRIVEVAYEIKNEYPSIVIDDAIKAASLSTPIEDKVSNDDKFNRLYNILLTIDKEHEEFPHVFNDAFNLYQDGLKNELYNNVMKEIIKYIEGERLTFPYLVE